MNTLIVFTSRSHGQAAGFHTEPRRPISEVNDSRHHSVKVTDYGLRARLPSLYSDFTPQRTSNPDGFAANITAWRDVLSKAARAGVSPIHSGFASDTLSVKTGEVLLQALETKEWGRPQALGTVIVGIRAYHSRRFGVEVLIYGHIG